MASDGGPKPYRVHYRSPSFAIVQMMPLLAKGQYIADMVGIIASTDIVMGDTDR